MDTHSVAAAAAAATAATTIATTTAVTPSRIDSAAATADPVAPTPSPLFLSSGVSGVFSNLFSPSAAFSTPLPCTVSASSAELVKRRAPNQTDPARTLQRMQREAKSSARQQALIGELQLDPDISEQQLEEMEVDAVLLQADIDKKKERLSVKLHKHAALQARLHAARELISERQKKQREARMARLRIQRAALFRQQSEQ